MYYLSQNLRKTQNFEPTPRDKATSPGSYNVKRCLENIGDAQSAAVLLEQDPPHTALERRSSNDVMTLGRAAWCCAATRSERDGYTSPLELK